MEEISHPKASRIRIFPLKDGRIRISFMSGDHLILVPFLPRELRKGAREIILMSRQDFLAQYVAQANGGYMLYRHDQGHSPLSLQQSVAHYLDEVRQDELEEGKSSDIVRAVLNSTAFNV